MRVREGTKATQGINGDAAVLEQWTGNAAAFIGTSSAAPCPYDHHRPTDWEADDGARCGACHPPPPALEVHALGDELALKRSRMAAYGRVAA